MVMSYFIIALAIVFFIGIFPLPLKFQAYYSTEQKRVYFTVKLFAISLYSGFLRYERGKLIETNFLGKSRPLNLKDIEINVNQYPDIGIGIFKRATFTKLNLFAEAGISGDPAGTAILYGALNSVLGGFFAGVRNRNGRIKLSGYVVPKIDRSIFELSIQSDFSVSVVSVIYSILKDFIKAGIQNVRIDRNGIKGQKRHREGA